MPLLFFEAKNIQKATSFFFKKGIFCRKFFYKKKHSQKIINSFLEKNIGIIITTIDYNFEKASENVSLEHF